MDPEWLDAKYLSLGTYRRNGQVVATPIWFAPLDERLYAFSNENAGKVKRLRRSSDARIAVCDARGRPLGEWHPARARLVTDETLKRRAYASLRAKYGWRSLLLDFFSRLSGRIGHRVVLGIEPVEADPRARPPGLASPSPDEKSRREP